MAILSYGPNRSGQATFIVTVPRRGTAKPDISHFHSVEIALAYFSRELDVMNTRTKNELVIDASFRHARRAALAIARGLSQLGPNPSNAW